MLKVGNRKEGFGAPLVIAVVALILIVGAGVLALRGGEEEMPSDLERDATTENAAAREEGGGSAGAVTMEGATERKNGSIVAADFNYKGTQLAGSAAPLIDFNKADYDAARAAGKNIVLYFYATWCPICKEELSHLYRAFNELTDNSIVGFRVNFNDDNTDRSEEALAREHGVPYQHTKVFIKNGERILKSPEEWDTQRYLSEIQSAFN